MKKWLSLTVMTCILLGAAYLAIATEQGRKSVQSLENVQLALQDVEQRIAKYGATDELLQKRAAYVEALAQLNEQAGVSAPVETMAPAAPVAAAEAVVIPDPVKDNAYHAAQRTGNENDAMVNYYRMLWDRYESGADLTPAEKQDLYDSGMLDEGRYEEGGAIDAVGGPDGFGYRYVDNTGGDTATFAWIDIVGAPGAVELVDIRNADDTDDTLTLSFNFPFYGVNRTTVYPSANGAIGMAPTTSLNFSNSCTLPNTDVAFSTGAIFPFWDDQHTQTGGVGGVYASDSGSVWYKDEGDRVIIQWDSVGRFSGAAGYAYSYQAILYSDGKIKFQYLDLARTAANLPSATIAIQQGSTAPNNNFLIYSCNTLGNAAQDTIQNRAVWFYTSPFAVNDFSTSAVVAPVSPYRVEAGAAFNVVARFRNAGTATQSSPVKYTFNGGPVVSENTASLAQFATEDHDFTGTETAPSVPGSYSLTFYSDLLTDTDRSNDTLRVNVIVYEGRCCYDNGNSCLDTTAAYCTTVAGLFDTTKTCAANPCPIILNGGDLCADAVALNVGQQVNGSLVGSTPETGLPACGSGYNSTSNGRWYTVVGTGNTMTANMCDAGTNYDSEVFVFCGSCAGLTCIGGDDDGCTSPAPEAASIFSWCSVSGTTYYVLATSFSTTGNAGSYSLFISDNGTTCANPIDCNPTGRCCYLDVNGDPQCVDNLSAECAALGGTWNDALSCATTPCEIGRCCYLLGGAGACEDNTLLECNALAGTWTDAADCATTPCAVGRCCYLDNGVAACADVIQLECTFLGGTWVDALDCATTPCEIGRCCYDDNGTTLCTDNTVLECNALAGSWNDALDCATSACPVILQGADLCANAVLVTVGQSVAGTLAGSTPETGIPTCGSGYSTTSNGVWYTVVGTGNTMTASMCDPITNYDSELFVFCGGCDGFVCIGGSDDFCGTASQVSWCSSNGNSYLVLVTSFGTTGNSGNYALTISDDGIPCTGAIECTPLGRCCYLDGGVVACVENLQAECTLLGGSWNDALDCTTPCPTLGRCCYTGGSFCDVQCVDQVFQTECTTLGGTWTDGGTCAEACPSTYCTCNCVGQDNVYSTIAADATTYPIVDNASVSVTINVTATNPVTDLNVRLDLLHTFDGDLIITLTSPLGTIDTLSNRRGSSLENYLCTVFDDEAATAIGAGTAPFTGSYIPEQLLSAFDGENPVGDWILTVSDNAGLDQGYIVGVCLELEAPPAPCDPIVDLRVYITTVGSQPDHVQLHFTAPQDEDYIVYSTTNPGNDGNPDSGADADFTIEATLPGLLAGPNIWNAPAGFVGLPPVGAPKFYVVVADCPAQP